MAKIRLTESDLRNIIKESVKRILKESDTGNFDDFYEQEESKENMNPEVHNKLMQLGVRDVTNIYYDNNADDDGCHSYEYTSQFLSKSGAERLKRKGCIYQWFIMAGDKIYCSRHNFNNEDAAADNCDKYTSIIEHAGIFPCEAYVEGIWLENDGTCSIDCVLCYEEDGSGDGFWND